MLAVILLDRSPTSPKKKTEKRRKSHSTHRVWGGGGGGGGQLDREGNMMFAGRALVVASVDGSVSDQLQ